jgi:NADH-quinone oxidoreductase subunit A
MIPTALDPVSTLVFFLIVFAVVGAFFLFIHLVMGSVIRPSRPDTEKLTIYECGEPTVGSAWVQFDLRYYVVALLFVIFDVEVAFFFPWATVFGTANQIAAIPKEAKDEGATKKEPTAEVLAHRQKRAELSSQLVPSAVPPEAVRQMGLTRISKDQGDKSDSTITVKLEAVPIDQDVARSWAQIAFFDIIVFFAVLMVGFAYVWRRGDIDWVRAYQHHKEPVVEPEQPLEQKVGV